MGFPFAVVGALPIGLFVIQATATAADDEEESRAC